jgi:pterin-4a-carbinolamine dehydratase
VLLAKPRDTPPAAHKKNHTKNTHTRQKKRTPLSLKKQTTKAIAFFDAVCGVAEAEQHHPDLHLTNYRDVEVVLSTHAIGGLARADFILAAKLDALDVEYSPKWLRESGGAGGGGGGAAAGGGGGGSGGGGGGGGGGAKQ